MLASVDDGPGYVARMFFTRFSVADLLRGYEFFASGDLGRFENEVLRIYVDDLSRPAFVIPLADVGRDRAVRTAIRRPQRVRPYVLYADQLHTTPAHRVGRSLSAESGITITSVCSTRTGRRGPFRPGWRKTRNTPPRRDAPGALRQNPRANGCAVSDGVPFELPPQGTMVIFEDDAAGTIVLFQLAFDTIEPAAIERPPVAHVLRRRRRAGRRGAAGRVLRRTRATGVVQDTAAARGPRK